MNYLTALSVIIIAVSITVIIYHYVIVVPEEKLREERTITATTKSKYGMDK